MGHLNLCHLPSHLTLFRYSSLTEYNTGFRALNLGIRCTVLLEIWIVPKIIRTLAGSYKKKGCRQPNGVCQVTDPSILTRIQLKQSPFLSIVPITTGQAKAISKSAHWIASNEMSSPDRTWLQAVYMYMTTRALKGSSKSIDPR